MTPATRRPCPAAQARAAALQQDAHETIEAMIRLAMLAIAFQDCQLVDA